MPRILKTIGAVLCLVFALCFAPPNARADSLFEYTVSSTDPFLAFSFTTVPIPISDLGVALPTSDLSAFSLTGSGYRGGPLTGVILDAGGVGIIHLSYASAATANPTFFAAADYSSPGTYTGAASATMVVTAVATPEPGSLVFMLSGVGLVFAMRKRFSDPRKNPQYYDAVSRCSARSDTCINRFCSQQSRKKFTGTIFHILWMNRHGKGIVVAGCPARKKRINTMTQFLDHLANDVMPALIDQLSAASSTSA